MKVQDLQMAWRNVIRHHKRSMMAVIVVTLGYFAINMAVGYALFSYSALAKQSADRTGHITVSHADYFDGIEDVPMQNGMENWKPLSKKILVDDRVRMTVPHVKFSGLLSNGDKSEIFVGDGTTVAGMRTQALNIELVDGRPFAKKTAEQSDVMEIMVGTNMLKSLSLDVGDIVTIMAVDTDGVLNALDATIVGVVDTGIPDLNRRYVATQYTFAQSLMGTNKISYLSVLLGETHYTDGMIEFINAQKTPFITTHWEDLALFYQGVVNLYNRIFGAMVFLIALVVFFSVNNVITMSVAERTKEIGTLRAMGAYPRTVIFGFVVEGQIIALFGGIIGAVLVFATYIFLTVADIQMPPPPGQSRTYPLMIEIQGQVLVWTMAILAGICLLASFITSKTGAKKPIVEALSDA